MSAESDLLRVVLALQNAFITREQTADIGATWAGKRAKSLTALLQEKGCLKPKALKALDSLVEAKIAECADPGKILASLPMDDDVREIFRGLLPEPVERGTLLRWAAPGSPSSAPPAADEARAALAAGDETVDMPSSAAAPAPNPLPALRLGASEKYEFGNELGRGGLGRVVEAVDRDFGRNVAVKMMLPGSAGAASVERFLLEARAAGRLSHPNIVPVHEIGVREEPVGATHASPLQTGIPAMRKVPYFTMAKIVGRDLGRILGDLEAGDEQTCKRFTRPRLLRVFQDVCKRKGFPIRQRGRPHVHELQHFPRERSEACRSGLLPGGRVRLRRQGIGGQLAGPLLERPGGEVAWVAPGPRRRLGDCSYRLPPCWPLGPLGLQHRLHLQWPAVMVLSLQDTITPISPFFRRMRGTAAAGM